MDDKKFREMDQSLMKKTEPLREQRVSEGMLKGFSTSVERRVSLPGRQAGGGAVSETRKTGGRLVWVPALAVMVLASVAVLRSPVHEIQLAQAVAPAEELQDDIAVLRELGVLDEYDDAALLGEEEALLDESMELTQKIGSSSALV